MKHFFISKQTKAAQSKISELEKNIQTLKQELHILSQAQSKIVSDNHQNVQDQKQTCNEQSHLKIVSDEPTPQPDIQEPIKEEFDFKVPDELKTLINKINKIEIDTPTLFVFGLSTILFAGILAASLKSTKSVSNNSTKKRSNRR